jgi:hypothetical protein
LPFAFARMPVKGESSSVLAFQTQLEGEYTC